MRLNKLLPIILPLLIIYTLVDVSTINVKCLSNCNVVVGKLDYEFKIIMGSDSICFVKDIKRIEMQKDEILTIFVVKRSNMLIRLLQRLKFERIFSHIPQGDYICVNIKSNTYRPFTPPKNIGILENTAFKIREVSLLRQQLNITTI